MQFLRACGFAIKSRLPLPELSPAADISLIEHGSDSVEISLGPLEESVFGLKPAGVLYSAGRSRLYLRIPGLGRLDVKSGRSIRMELEDGSCSDYARTVILSSVLGAIVHQRGMLGLHANTLTPDGQKAVVLAGQCGSGKSTLAAQLIMRGWRSLADDLSAVSISPKPLIHPFGPFLRLWSDAVDRLKLDRGRLTRCRPGLNKWVLSLFDSEFHLAPLPVASIVILTRTPRPSRLLERLSGAQSVSEVLKNAYRRNFIQPMNLAQSHFARALSIVACVPVFRLHCDFNDSRAEEVIEAVTATLAAGHN